MSHNVAPIIERRILSHKEVVHITGLSRPTILRLIRNGLFPRSRRMSPGRCGFFADDINQWIENNEFDVWYGYAFRHGS